VLYLEYWGDSGKEYPMNVSPQELTVVGTLGGVLLGGLFGFLSAWISKRSEERRSFNELVVRVASEQYLHETDIAVKREDWVWPYQVFLIDILQLAKIVNKRFLTRKRIIRLLKRGERITGAVEEHTVELTKKSKSKPTP
jgi:hypothetical protein